MKHFRYDSAPVLSSLFEQHSPLEQTLDSYNQFIAVEMQDIIRQTHPQVIDSADARYIIQYEGGTLLKPHVLQGRGDKYFALKGPLFPHEARIRSQDYSGALMVQVGLTRLSSADPKQPAAAAAAALDRLYSSHSHMVGLWPVATGSTACWLQGATYEWAGAHRHEDGKDSHGEFILNGTSYTIVNQENLAINQPYVFRKSNRAKGKGRAARKAGNGGATANDRKSRYAADGNDTSRTSTAAHNAGLVSAGGTGASVTKGSTAEISRLDITRAVSTCGMQVPRPIVQNAQNNAITQKQQQSGHRSYRTLLHSLHSTAEGDKLVDLLSSLLGTAPAAAATTNNKAAGAEGAEKSTVGKHYEAELRSSDTIQLRPHCFKIFMSCESDQRGAFVALPYFSYKEVVPLWLLLRGLGFGASEWHGSGLRSPLDSKHEDKCLLAGISLGSREDGLEGRPLVRWDAYVTQARSDMDAMGHVRSQYHALVLLGKCLQKTTALTDDEYASHALNLLVRYLFPHVGTDSFNPYDDCGGMGDATAADATWETRVAYQQTRHLVASWDTDCDTATPAVPLVKGKAPVDHITIDRIARFGNLLRQKAQLVLVMLTNLIRVHAKTSPLTDRDDYAHKRVDMCGTFLRIIFRYFWLKFVRAVGVSVSKMVAAGQVPDVQAAFNQHTNTFSINVATCIKRGFLPTRSHMNRVSAGISQVLDRFNPAARGSHRARIGLAIEEKSKKNPYPKYLHPNQWGFKCPGETPDGAEGVGLVGNMALSNLMTYGTHTNLCISILRDHFTDLIDTTTHLQPTRAPKTRVLVDGIVVGTCRDIPELIQKFEEAKRHGLVPHPCSIVHRIYESAVWIHAGEGRACRPVLRLEPGVPDDGPQRLLYNEKHDALLRNRHVNGYTFQDMLRDGVVCFIDADIQRHAIIATHPMDMILAFERYKKDQNPTRRTIYEYCDIDPSLIFGMASARTPFSDSNPSPKNSFFCSLIKQTLFGLTNSQAVRMDKKTNYIWYPQKPLVAPSIAKHYQDEGTDISGFNALVAVLSQPGTSEDAYRFNRNMKDFGALCGTTLITRITPACEQTAHSWEEIGTPEQHGGAANVRDIGARANYTTIESDGLTAPGIVMEQGDTLAGRTLHTKNGKSATGTTTVRDRSQTLQGVRSAQVTRVAVYDNIAGQRMVKTQLAIPRRLQRGDKFSSRHGQKGTVGEFVSREDMPWTLDGISPDVVINPHAMSSRMTVGQPHESVAGSFAIANGIEFDGAAFQRAYVEYQSYCNAKDKGVDPPEATGGLDGRFAQFTDFLKLCGWKSDTKQALFSGTTGEYMGTAEMGYVYMQRIQQMAADKIFTRANGKVAELSRQPNPGRANEGALRVGEMEVWCLLAWGQGALTHDRLFLCSDVFYVPVCTGCQFVAVKNEAIGLAKCKGCDRRGKPYEIIDVAVPYSFKLLAQEVYAMGVSMKLNVSKVAEKVTEMSSRSATHPPRRPAARNNRENRDSMRREPWGSVRRGTQQPPPPLHRRPSSPAYHTSIPEPELYEPTAAAPAAAATAEELYVPSAAPPVSIFDTDNVRHSIEAFSALVLKNQLSHTDVIRMFDL